MTESLKWPNKWTREKLNVLLYKCWIAISWQLLCLHYRSGPNRAEPNSAGPAVQTMLAWFGPAHFSSVLWLFTLSNKLGWPVLAHKNVPSKCALVYQLVIWRDQILANYKFFSGWQILIWQTIDGHRFLRMCIVNLTSRFNLTNGENHQFA